MSYNDQTITTSNSSTTAATTNISAKRKSMQSSSVDDDNYNDLNRNISTTTKAPDTTTATETITAAETAISNSQRDSNSNECKNLQQQDHQLNKDSSSNIIYIDGSLGEGGGQIIRNAITYAVILQKEIIINNIRAKRSKPGLQAQHVTCIQLATSIYAGGTITGNTIQSSQIHYIPSLKGTKTNDENESGKNDSKIDTRTKERIRYITGDTGTAGSICLLLQVALPCAICNASLSFLSKIQLNLKGGTNASMAPQYDYWYHVFLPTIQNHCLQQPNSNNNITNNKNTTKTIESTTIDSNTNTTDNFIKTNVLRRGFFPKGGGHVQVTINPKFLCPKICQLQPITLINRGDIKTIYIRSYHAGNLPRHIAQEMAKIANEYFQNKFTTTKSSSSLTSTSTTRTDIVYKTYIISETNVLGSSFGILIIATTTTGCIFGGSSLSSQSKNCRGATVAKQACDELWISIQNNNKSCVDIWLQDQLILFMTLATGVSTIIIESLSLHSQTAILIAEQMTNAKFTITKLDTNIDTEICVANTSTNSVTTEHNSNNTSSTFQDTAGNHHDDDDDIYGRNGSIPGRHMIQCVGIGWSIQ